jgi:hypothetical protein
LIGWEAVLDDWSGDDIVTAVIPWFLASLTLCDAIEAAHLTGLRVGMAANLSYSGIGEILASLGELATKESPEFRIVVPEHPIEVRRLDDEEDAIGPDDDLRYEGWSGDDFAYSRWGPVLTERALSVVKAHRTRDCEFWPLAPK